MLRQRGEQIRKRAAKVVASAIWADDMPEANLYNKEGFPALPFRTDKWKAITDGKKYAIAGD